MFVTRYLYVKLDNLFITSIGPSLRRLGQKIINHGVKFQGELYQGDRSKI